jgi:hypothetical protein
MDYKRIYDDLMETRLSAKKERIKQKKQGSYFERHHIIPLSMGGNKSYALSSDNIVLLIRGKKNRPKTLHVRR